MKCATIFLLLALHASAAIVRRSSSCCFQLSSTGHTTGPLSQLSDGQNRIGGASSPATYCINKDAGTITDSSGRGCILTAPTSQFQCDTDAQPSTGFSIDSSGNILHAGSASFYACPATTNGEYNVYTTPVAGQTECVPIGLNTGGQCASSPSSASSALASSAPAPSVVKPSVAASSVVKSSVVAPSVAAPSVVQSSVVASSVAAPSVAASSAPANSAPLYPAPASGYPAPSGGYPAPSGGYPAPASGYPAPSAPSPVASSAPAVSSSSASKTAAPPTSATAPTSSASSSVNCVAQEDACRVAPNANQSFCSAQRAGCDGYVPGQGYISSTASGSPAPTTPVASSASSPAAPVASTQVCPTDLSGLYQYPHLIVPVDSTKPDTSLGNGYQAHMSSTISTIYTFDIPQSYAGKTCQLEFLFPTKDKLQTSNYSMTGSGSITFYILQAPASSGTTFNSKPAVFMNLGTVPATPGSSAIIGTYACIPGTGSILASSSGNMDLSYFQDYNPLPIGLYVAAC